MSTGREILLTGSVPLRPAANVFETVSAHLGTLAPRIPDGEQIGWSGAARRTFERHPMLEESKRVPLNAHGADPVPIFRLKLGFTVRDLKLGPYGYFENAMNSYREFKRLRDEGKIAPGIRYQCTLPGPGTSAFSIELPGDEILPLSRVALGEELDRIVAAIPADDLSVQIDVGMEAEHEEYLRRPDAFDQPLHKVFHWTLDQMADSVAWLANRVPASVELGFHICSIWHHDPEAGQDNTVLVDAANAITRRLTRGVSYLHLPVIPDHVDADYAKFKQLERGSKTKLYIGLLNFGDGLEGAKRRIAIAEKFVSDFGIGSFCGLGRPASPDTSGPTAHSHPPIPALRRATAETIGEYLDIHRAAALL